MIRARGRVLLKVNVAAAEPGCRARRAAVDDLADVTPLADGQLHGVESVVPKKGVNTLIPKLKAAGAFDILELPISKIVE